jgi:hypothetical protein
MLNPMASWSAEIFTSISLVRELLKNWQVLKDVLWPIIHSAFNLSPAPQGMGSNVSSRIAASHPGWRHVLMTNTVINETKKYFGKTERSRSGK